MVGHRILLDDGRVKGQITLDEAFFNPQFITDNGVCGMVRGLALQPAQESDELVVDELRNLLFGNVQDPSDLPSLNMQRGRDHGLPGAPLFSVRCVPTEQ